ncbi:MAG: response regulator [Paracoccaceae bacterium]
MPDTNESFPALARPTADRPLLGMTILVVEDSRYACEALRLLCLRSGARIRRADCLRSARRHLQTYRPGVVIIDLGLPDGSGEDLIRELAQAVPRMPVILGTSGDPAGASLSLHAGADGFLPKPVESLMAFQRAILGCFAGDGTARQPVQRAEPVVPDRIALRDDLTHVAEILAHSRDEPTLGYAARFLRGLARSSHDRPLEEAAAALAGTARSAIDEQARDRLTGMVNARLDASPGL